MLEGRYGVFRAHLPGRTDVDFAALTEGLRARWHIRDSAFKLYPCAHSIHAFIEAALDASVAPESIAEVVLDIPADFVGQIAEPRAAKLAPRTPTHARASVYYAVAAALADGTVGMRHYTDAAIRRPDLLALAARMRHWIVPGVQPIRFSSIGLFASTCPPGRRRASPRSARRRWRASPRCRRRAGRGCRRCAA